MSDETKTEANETTDKVVWWVNVYRVGQEEPSLGHLHPTEYAAAKIGRGRKGYIKTIPIEVG